MGNLNLLIKGKELKGDQRRTIGTQKTQKSTGNGRGKKLLKH